MLPGVAIDTEVQRVGATRQFHVDRERAVAGHDSPSDKPRAAIHRQTVRLPCWGETAPLTASVLPLGEKNRFAGALRENAGAHRGVVVRPRWPVMSAVSPLKRVS